MAAPICILKVDLDCCAKCPMKIKRKLQKINGVYYINMDTKKGLVLVSGDVNALVLQKTIKDTGKKAELLAYEKEPMQAKKKLDKLFKNMQKGQDKKDHKNCSHKDRKTTQSRGEEQSCSSGSDSDHDKHDDDCAYAQRKAHKKKSMNIDKNMAKGPDETISMAYPAYGNGMGSNSGGFGWYGQRVVDPRAYGSYRGLPPGYARPHYAGRPYGGYPGYHPAIHDRPLPPPPPATLPPPPPATLPPPPPPRPPQMPLSNLYALYSGQKEPPVGNSLYHAFNDDNVKACRIM